MVKTIFFMIFICVSVAFSAHNNPNDKFDVALLRYDGDWNGREKAVKALMIEVMNRTSINAALLATPLSLADAELFSHPFLLMTGTRGFAPWSQTDRKRLKQYLEYGGTLLIDNSSGMHNNDFDLSVRRELGAIFPENKLAILPQDHSIYRTFYLFNKSYFGGRVKTAPYLEGITLDDYTPVIYSLNDVAGAWEKNEANQFVYDLIPGGEVQRQEAFKFGVNVVLYALTMNYKKDAVHVKALLKRRRR